MYKYLGFLGFRHHNCLSMNLLLMWNKPWLLKLEESSHHQVKKKKFYIWERSFICMNLCLFKKICCFFFFWTIFCKMAWSFAHKTDFWSLSFKLLSFEKLPFFLSKKFLLWSCMVSPFQGILLEMISPFCWTITVFLIALYLQIFSFATVFKFTVNLFNF